MVADASGAMVSELRYSAFGEIRYQSGLTPTDFLYTGQRQEAEIGLYYYVARWYDPAIGRFIQADSIVPNPLSAFGYDRFSYAFNNPFKFTDPSGHDPEDLVDFVIDGQDWKENEMATILEAIAMTAQTLADELNRTIIRPLVSVLSKHNIIPDIVYFSADEAFLVTYGGKVTVKRSSSEKDYAAEITGTNEITYYNVNLYAKDEEGNPYVYEVDDDWTAGYVGHTVHELGHLIDNRTGNKLRSKMTGDLTVTEVDRYRGFVPRRNIGRFNTSTNSNEVWADMFYGWVTGTAFSEDAYGIIRKNHMNSNMSKYILIAINGN